MADQDYNRGNVGGTNWWDSTATARIPVSDSGAAVSTSGSSVVVFPPDHSMGLGLSSDQPPWNHPTLILRGEKVGAELGGGGGGGFRSMLQQGMTPFSATEPEFKPIKGAFSVDQPFLDTSSYGNFQALMGATSDQQGGGGGGFGYHQQLDYGTGSGGGGWNNTTTNKVDHLQHQFLKPNSMADKPNPSFWNMEAAMAPSSFFPPLIQQHQINIPCFEDKPQHNIMEVRDTSGPGRKTSGSSSEQTATTTSSGGTASKRSRNEASSTLPPFKVRKEKMGDRITALQQLVSPFGKTDTASVLSEAIEYIKFLHEQVNVLSTPYLKSGASLQQQQTSEKDPEVARQDLRSRGLCLVPVSSTFPVAHETTVDFWTPTFGGTFR